MKKAGLRDDSDFDLQAQLAADIRRIKARYFERFGNKFTLPALASTDEYEDEAPYYDSEHGQPGD